MERILFQLKHIELEYTIRFIRIHPEKKKRKDRNRARASRWARWLYVRHIKTTSTYIIVSSVSTVLVRSFVFYSRNLKYDVSRFCCCFVLGYLVLPCVCGFFSVEKKIRRCVFFEHDGLSSVPLKMTDKFSSTVSLSPDRPFALSHRACVMNLVFVVIWI